MLFTICFLKESSIKDNMVKPTAKWHKLVENIIKSSYLLVFRSKSQMVTFTEETL